MLLAIDIGNTHTVVGLFSGDTLAGHWRMSSAAHRTGDESWLTIRSFCLNNGIDPSKIRLVGISSVVPNLTEVFATIASRYVGVSPHIVGAGTIPGMNIRYHDPASVGADRLCNAVAGFTKYGGPLIIVDFGTATTFDIIDVQGDYLGGVICLGVESSAAELHRRAARLPKVELIFPESVVARDTVSSIQAGLMIGTVESVEGIVRRIREEIGHQAGVIATGGLAPVIAKHTDIIQAIEPSLVLEGIRLIVERTIAERQV
ncbi:MAG: type III pantothenate kinase [Ignavibacteria bacterium]|nr:type III pantothenate kinase [Ignavibacteria bacterium]